MTEKEKYQKHLERLVDDYFIKIYYAEDKVEFDWILNPKYTPEDLRIAVLGLRYYETTVKSPTKEALIAAYKKGQESVTAIRNTHTYKEESDIKEILRENNLT